MDWSAMYKNASPDLVNMISRPDEWQSELADKIRSLAGNGTILEAGCGYGVTSLLVGGGCRRTLLDLVPKAIDIAGKLFDMAGQQATFVVGDLFRMEFPDNTFDLVFNAGVLEHFDQHGRAAALAEMVRVTKPGGKIVVALPNHYSIPYRFSYKSRKARGKWPYPDEERIFDLSAEFSDMDNVIMVARETIGERTMFHFLSRAQKILFKVLHLIKGYEGYLTILTHEKLETERTR